MARAKKTRNASALSDHAHVRGVRKGRANKKRGDRDAARRAAARRGGSLLAAGLGLMGLVYGAVELRAWALATPRLCIETIELVGASRAQEGTLRQLAGVEVGQNLVATDADAIEAAVVAHPWVAAATVKKRYPRGLEIRIEEHEPVALVALEHLYYADATGEIVKRYAPGERVALPVVTGLSRASVEDDDPEAKALLTEALGFLSAWASFHGESAPRVAEVHVDPVMGLSFVLEDDEARVQIGAAPYEEKFERWATVQATLEARGVVASRITLSGTRRPERVVAQLRRRAGVDASPKERGGARRSADATVVASGPGGATSEVGR